MKKNQLSVTLATYNEESNLARCLESVRDLADEIVIVDGQSTDKTVEIAQKYGAKVEILPNQSNFHINKQHANDSANGKWILQLDADEVLSSELSHEIKRFLQATDQQRNEWPISSQNQKLFTRQQQQLETRDNHKIGADSGDVIAFFIPRQNYFLNYPMRHTGVYPDGVIRLFKKGFAHLPAKHVHEQYQVNGRVGWLNNPLHHFDSPTFDRYLTRNARYASLFAQDLAKQNVSLNWNSAIYYIFIKPLQVFISLWLRHGGYKDKFPGLVFSLYSGLTWAQAYIKYWEKNST